MAPHAENVVQVLTEPVGDKTYDRDPIAVLTAKAVTMGVLCVVSICMGVAPILGYKWYQVRRGDKANPR